MHVEKLSNCIKGLAVGHSFGEGIFHIDDIDGGGLAALDIEVDIQGAAGQRTSRIERIDAFYPPVRGYGRGDAAGSAPG